MSKTYSSDWNIVQAGSGGVGGDRYDWGEIGHDNKVLEAQTKGALLALGTGVVLGGAVTAGSGLSVNIGALIALANGSTLGPCVLQTSASVARTMPASSTSYLFAAINAGAAQGTPQNSLETRAPLFAVAGTSLLDGGVLLATVTTSSSGVTGVVDNRSFVSLGASDGNQMANLVKAGPAAGAAAAPAYRALVGADLPTATTTLKGGVQLAANGAATGGRAVAADDSRLSDARTPLAHAPSHRDDGDDPLSPADIGAAAASDLTAVSDAFSAHLSDSDPHTQYLLADGSRVWGGDADAGGFKITNLGTPSAPGDAVPYSVFSSLSDGYKDKPNVKVATTGNVGTLSGLITVDGVALVAGDRVLVKDQTTASQNGIYTVAPGAWSRASDADADDELLAGTRVYVPFGTANGYSSWTMITPSVSVGTTAQLWTQTGASGGGEVDTGGNLGSGARLFSIKSGLTLLFRSLMAGSSKLTVVEGSDNIALDVAESNLTISNMGGTLGIAHGGTGATGAAGALTSLGVAFASQTDAETGTSGSVYMNPLRTAQAIAALAAAGTTLATQAEAQAGTNNTHIMTPLRTAQAIAMLASEGGGSGALEIQHLSYNAGGGFQLTFGEDSITTLPQSTTAHDIQDALNALPGIISAGYVDVTGTSTNTSGSQYTGQFDITFRSPGNQSQITTGSPGYTMTTTTQGSPNPIEIRDVWLFG